MAHPRRTPGAQARKGKKINCMKPEIWYRIVILTIKSRTVRKKYTPCVRIWKCSVNYWCVLSCVLKDKLNNLLSICHWKFFLNEPSISHHIRVVCQQNVKLSNIWSRPQQPKPFIANVIKDHLLYCMVISLRVHHHQYQHRTLEFETHCQNTRRSFHEIYWIFFTRTPDEYHSHIVFHSMSAYHLDLQVHQQLHQSALKQVQLAGRWSLSQFISFFCKNTLSHWYSFAFQVYATPLSPSLIIFVWPFFVPDIDENLLS